MPTIPNISWLFYKDYYADLQVDATEAKTIDFKKRNDYIYAQKLAGHNTQILKIPKDLANTSFPLRTQYPGLLTGSGISHAVGKNDSEIKLGFSFDHSSGLPYLPGSTVKGLLRSYFPGQLQKLAKKTNGKQQEALNVKVNSLQQLWMQYLLPGIGLQNPNNIDLNLLEANIFNGIDPKNGEPQSIYLRDIFFDAYPTRSFFQGSGPKDQGRFLGEGVITPHKYKGKSNPLKNPTPIKFLKILPEVSVQFQFRLAPVTINGTTITIVHKQAIFQAILEHFGIGAKTNVGFGQLEEDIK